MFVIFFPISTPERMEEQLAQTAALPDCLLIWEHLSGASITASANHRLLVAGWLWGTAKPVCPQELPCSASQLCQMGFCREGSGARL